MFRAGLLLLLLGRATEGLGVGSLTLGGLLLGAGLLEYIMDVSFQLDELVCLEIPLLGQELFPFWVPVLHQQADVKGDLS